MIGWIWNLFLVLIGVRGRARREIPCTLSLSIWRDDVTPERGQEMLKRMNEALASQAAGPGWTVIKTPDNVHENPFPEWLVALLNKEVKGLEYNSFNQNFSARFKSPKKAQRIAMRLNGDFKLDCATKLQLSQDQLRIVNMLSAVVLSEADDVLGNFEEY